MVIFVLLPCGARLERRRRKRNFRLLRTVPLLAVLFFVSVPEK
jgi:hypothetical protein